jgi:hypothetical protein
MRLCTFLVLQWWMVVTLIKHSYSPPRIWSASQSEKFSRETPTAQEWKLWEAFWQ